MASVSTGKLLWIKCLSEALFYSLVWGAGGRERDLAQMESNGGRHMGLNSDLYIHT